MGKAERYGKVNVPYDKLDRHLQVVVTDMKERSITDRQAANKYHITVEAAHRLRRNFVGKSAEAAPEPEDRPLATAGRIQAEGSKTRSRLTDDEKLSIGSMLEDGKSIYAVAKKAGRSETAVKKVASDLGIELPQRAVKPTREDEEAGARTPAMRENPEGKTGTDTPPSGGTQAAPKVIGNVYGEAAPMDGFTEIATDNVLECELCSNRHITEKALPAPFPVAVRKGMMFDFQKQESEVESFLRAYIAFDADGIPDRSVRLYSSGLLSLNMSFVTACDRLGVNLTVMEHDQEDDKYLPQDVITGRPVADTVPKNIRSVITGARRAFVKGGLGLIDDGEFSYVVVSSSIPPEDGTKALDGREVYIFQTPKDAIGFSEEMFRGMRNRGEYLISALSIGGNEYILETKR